MATMVQITFDCADPRSQPQFWMTALGYVPDGWPSPEVAAAKMLDQANLPPPAP